MCIYIRHFIYSLFLTGTAYILLIGLFIQKFNECLYSSGTMAYLVFYFITQFSKCLFISFRNKYRVVSESFRSVFGGSDMSVDNTFKLVYFTVNN